ncbi:hypothetical protein GQ55_9G270600 [Panicum hallii var. hallii]|uniref:Uncharacterized protein n=1 Tax=Panicum hallii var. hallii TaxID=1504633 RepID=A0A2T7C7D7_9POAL|nr:hypothetical protein GQ55_9G270600 [Panicum hallii var. hallii]
MAKLAYCFEREFLWLRWPSAPYIHIWLSDDPFLAFCSIIIIENASSNNASRQRFQLLDSGKKV